MMKHTIGTVTIGQSPRIDVVPEIAAILGDNIIINEAGALDGLSKEEIAALAPEVGDYVLVTRLNDGSSVQVAEKHITPKIIEKIQAHFKNGASLVLLLCTGEFPGFEPDGFLIQPQKLLFNTVKAIAEGKKVGILVPSAEQLSQSERRWSQASRYVKAVAASPYVNPAQAVEAAANELKAWGAELSVLDCIGYSEGMKETVRTITGAPAITGRGLAAHTVRELLG